MSLKSLLRFFCEYVAWTFGFLVLAASLVLNVSVEAFRYAGF